MPLKPSKSRKSVSQCRGDGETEEGCAKSSKEANGYVHAREEAGAVFSKAERLVAESAVSGQAATEPRAEQIQDRWIESTSCSQSHEHTENQ